MKPQRLTVAEKAKSALLQRGWRQGFPLAVGDERLCLAEALVVALGDTGQAPGVALAAVNEAVRPLGFKDACEAIAWNDTPGRTLEEVLERLEQLTIHQKAKSILLERGWRQGARACGDGRLCLAEALVAALDEAGQLPDGVALRTIAKVARHIGFKDASEAVDWNDATGRTFEQVLERLDTWA